MKSSNCAGRKAARLRRAVVVLAGCVFVPSLRATAAVPGEARGESVSVPAERTEVVLGITGDPGEGVRSGLAQMLEAGLRRQGLVLVVQEPEGELSSFAERAAAGERTLMVAVLDARKPSGWRLIVIDAARDRAIARDLGAIEQNAASVEAIASIVLSATGALREGLEVASSPTESVVTPGAPKPAAPVSVTEQPAERRGPPSTEPGTALHFALSGEVLSFSSPRAATAGGNAAVALTLGASLELRASFSYHPPISLETELGAFDLERFVGTLSAGPYLRVGKLALIPAAGLATESLHRSESAPALGVAAQEDDTSHRVGGLLALRARFRLIPPVSLEMAGGAAYFPQPIHFVTAAPDSEQLADVKRVIFFAQLGISGAVD